MSTQMVGLADYLIMHCEFVYVRVLRGTKVLGEGTANAIRKTIDYRSLDIKSYRVYEEVDGTMAVDIHI